MLEIRNLPDKFHKLWQKCVPLLKQGRPDDLEHAKEVVEFILDYKGDLQLDLDILVPIGIMHDIGHSAILDEHFHYITGSEKFVNGKLAHMLVGAKIARDLLNEVGYPKEKAKEIVDMISTHDFDQLQGIDRKAIYNTENKRIFYDIDILDRFNAQRIKKMEKLFPDKDKLMELIRGNLKDFFYDEFRRIAESRFGKLSS